MPVDNLCIQCGERPRKFSKSGKQLTMCDSCQRDYWREKKRESGGHKPRKKKVVRQRTVVHRDQPQKRKCKNCKITKPISEFRPWGMTYRRTCKTCEGIQDSSSTPPLHSNHILLVNGDHIVLAKVISQKSDTHNTDRIVEFYKQQGYQIEHVFEKEKIS